MTILWIVIAAVAACGVAFFAAPWLIRLVDRSGSNSRTTITYEHELPRYFIRGKGGVDTAAQWPGWDAWTVCAIPTDPGAPPQMVRGTLMTGLYGLEGVDNYEQLMFRLSTNDVVEHLCIIPTTSQLPDGSSVVLNNLSQSYLPKDRDLRMADGKLDVTVVGSRVDTEVTNIPYGEIRGRWPNYQIGLLSPAAEIEAEMTFEGQRVLWWIDVPGRYTHFATLGRFQVTIRYMRGVNVADIHRPEPRPEESRFEARGAVEHICAARLVGFDHVWRRLLSIGNWIPALKAVRHHYEVFLGDVVEGGIMHTRALGRTFRNGGGLYEGESYHEVRSVRVRYEEADAVDNCGGIGDYTAVWRRWHVEAVTDAGPLTYTAERTHSPAMVSPNGSQYHFTYSGTWGSQAIAGRGYGEYFHF
jgi:hypothetical protein